MTLVKLGLRAGQFIAAMGFSKTVLDLEDTLRIKSWGFSLEDTGLGLGLGFENVGLGLITDKLQSQASL